MGDVHVLSPCHPAPEGLAPQLSSPTYTSCPCASQKNVMQALLGAGAMAEDDLLSKLEECIEVHRDAAKRAKLKTAESKDQNKATLDSVVSVLNTQLDPLGLKVCSTSACPRGRHTEGCAAHLACRARSSRPV